MADIRKDPKRVQAGNARAKSLSPERRAEIARKARQMLAGEGDVPTADYEGDFPLGGDPISCAVLQNGTRIITQVRFLRALGRSRSPKAGTGVLSTVDELPFFLQAEALRPFISDDLMQSTTPIFYRTKAGGKSVGYDARLLPMVAEVYLRFRDFELKQHEEIPSRYERMIWAADILIRALANIGIIALVDEATRFQRDPGCRCSCHNIGSLYRKGTTAVGTNISGRILCTVVSSTRTRVSARYCEASSIFWAPDQRHHLPTSRAKRASKN